MKPRGFCAASVPVSSLVLTEERGSCLSWNAKQHSGCIITDLHSQDVCERRRCQKATGMEARAAAPLSILNDAGRGQKGAERCQAGGRRGGPTAGLCSSRTQQQGSCAEPRRGLRAVGRMVTPLTATVPSPATLPPAGICLPGPQSDRFASET